MSPIKDLMNTIEKVNNDALDKNMLLSLLKFIYLPKEKEEITKAFIAGYNSRSNEDIIGGTGNEENEYYDSNFGDNPCGFTQLRTIQDESQQTQTNY
jgi:hypothetical protein